MPRKDGFGGGVADSQLRTECCVLVMIYGVIIPQRHPSLASSVLTRPSGDHEALLAAQRLFHQVVAQLTPGTLRSTHYNGLGTEYSVTQLVTQRASLLYSFLT